MRGCTSINNIAEISRCIECLEFELSLPIASSSTVIVLLSYAESTCGILYTCVVRDEIFI